MLLDAEKVWYMRSEVAWAPYSSKVAPWCIAPLTQSAEEEGRTLAAYREGK